MRPSMVAFGIATLCSFPLLTPLASPRHLAVFHLRGSAASLFVPPLIYFAVFWLLFTLLLRAGRRYTGVRLLFWSVVVCALPWFGAKTLAVTAGAIVPAPVAAALIAISILCFFVAAGVILRRSQARLLPAIHFAETLFTFVAWSGVVLLVQVLWSFYAARNINTATVATADLHPVVSAGSGRMSAPSASKPRVIWIVLDELSYAQLFQNRFPGLSLPSFDRLAGQSTVFTNVTPAGFRTERVVPALITGLPVEHISASADGRRLTLETGLNGESRIFDARNTVFEDAVSAGYTTGVAGWYNPYCRILAGVLDRCAWVAHHDTLPGGFRTDATLGRDLVAPMLAAARFAGRLLSRPSDSTWTDRRAMDEHIDEYRDLEADSNGLLADSSIGFLFLHIAAPHPEGIYDRRKQDFTDDGRSSYIDNLALADRFLRQVEVLLDARGTWDTSAVIVMGDHSWRTRSLWRQLPGWTAEDEVASDHGRFDPRPAYLVKLPGQSRPARVDATFDAVRTRALLDGILRGQIRSPEQLARWAGQPIARPDSTR